MYADEVPKIAASGLNSPEGFARVCMFAVLSIRQSIFMVPEQVEECEASPDGVGIQGLWGWKSQAFQYLRSDAALDLFFDYHKTISDRDAIQLLMRVPGLGIVKSAFVAQMLGRNVACMDTRNQAREGRKIDQWHLRGGEKTRPIAQRKLDAYLAHVSGKA